LVFYFDRPERLRYRFGKLFSSSLVTFYLILGILPIVRFLLLGALRAGILEVALALLNVFFFSQSAGILISL